MLGAEERYRLLEEVSELSERWEYEEVLRALQPAEDQDLLLEPELAYLAALAHFRCGQRVRARALLQKQRSNFSHAGRERLYCRRTSLEGALHVEEGSLSEATKCFSEVMFIGVARDYPTQVTTAVMNMGVIEWIKCNWDEALAAFKRAIAAYQQLGQLYNLAAAHHNTAMAYRELACFDQAAAHCDKALEFFDLNSTSADGLYSYSEKALISLATGDLEFAESTARRAATLLQKYGNMQDEGEGLRVLGMVVKANGDTERSEKYLSKALELAMAANAKMLIAECRQELGQLFAENGRFDEAKEQLRLAAKIYFGMGAEKRATRVKQRLEERGYS